MSNEKDEEFYAGLPLHKEENPWINIVYTNDDKGKVDLKTLFLEAHNIKEASLPLPYSTAILYKIFVTIAYALLDNKENSDNFIQREKQWDRYREPLILNNVGFDPKRVEEYFKKFDDRFYLIHSHFPFMQDPYLKFGNKPFKELLTVPFIEPGRIPPESNKFIWGLPDDTDVTVNDENITERLVTAMLYQSYGYTTINKNSRKWSNSNIADTSYPSRSPLRSATHYIVNGDSLFQTILISCTFNPQFDNKDDIPSWEKDVNSLGYLGTNGFRVPVTDLYVYNGHRSFLNNSHLAFLYLVESNENGVPKGIVKSCRSISSIYDNKNKDKLSGSDPATIPLQRTYDPFAAPKITNGNKSKMYFSFTQEQITNKTIISVPSIYEIMFNIDDSYELPDCMNQFLGSKLEKIKNLNLRTRILVMSEEWNKDNRIAGVLDIKVPDVNIIKMLNDPNSTSLTKSLDAKYVSEWTNYSKEIANKLMFYATQTISDNDTFRGSFEKSNNLLNYWSNIQELFSQSLTDKGVKPISSYKSEIIQLVSKNYDEYAGVHQVSSPLKYAKNKSILLSAVRKIIK